MHVVEVIPRLAELGALFDACESWSGLVMPATCWRDFSEAFFSYMTKITRILFHLAVLCDLWHFLLRLS